MNAKHLASPSLAQATAVGLSLIAAIPSAGAASHGSAVSLSYGSVHFANSCAPSSQNALETSVAKLHSFEASATEFAAIGRRDPACAIAWWGAAMSERGNPLGDALDAKALRAGRGFIDRALAVKTTSAREAALIGAMDVYYRPYASQLVRARAYADKMDAVHAAYPDDPDIAAFDGLAIIEGVDLDDKTLSRQKRAGAILEQVMRTHPENPGAPHYLIHAYDYTGLAAQAVHAAEIYPTIATASSHAQHMPGHIWSMLGEWDKSIAANRAACFVADPSSNHDPIKGDIVFDHAMDFIVYARLQKAEDGHVAKDIAATDSPPFVVRARYALERGDWAAAAKLAVPDNDPFDDLLARFTRAYGSARSNNPEAAKRELAALGALKPEVTQSLGDYWAAYVDIYGSAVAAWILKDGGDNDRALAFMRHAADLDSGHEKHIYLENKLLPMRESLGDMELALGHPKEGLAAYTQSLTQAPNRYRSFAGAAEAAMGAGDKVAARDWWQKLMVLGKDGDDRPAFRQAKAFLAGNG